MIFYSEGLISMRFGENNMKYISENAFNRCDLLQLDLLASLSGISKRTFAFNEKPAFRRHPGQHTIDRRRRFLRLFGAEARLHDGRLYRHPPPNIAQDAFDGAQYCRIHVKDKAAYDLFRAKPELSSFTIIYG